MTNIVSFILNHPKKVLALIGITTYFFAISLIDLNYNFTIEQLFAKNKKESDTYFEFQKEFSREDNVFLLVHRLPIELNDNFIDSLYQITNTLRSSSYFIKIVSLTDIHSQSESLEGDNISARMLNMVSKDSTFGSIWITLKDEYNSFKKRSEVIDYLKRTTQEFDWNWTYSGIPVVRNTYVEYMIQDNIRFIPPVALILIIALAFLFRHWLYVVLPLVTVLITACWILGVMSITGKGLNVMTYMVPTLLFIIGVSDSIHLLSRLNIYLQKKSSMREALELSMKDMGLALFLTSLTTAIGFLALLYSSISIVQEFGLFIACGVFIAYLLTLTFIPSVLILMRGRIEIRSISQSNKRMKFLKNVSKIVRTKPKPIAAIAIFLTVILFTGAFNVSTGSSLLSDLHPKSGLYVDLKNVEKWFGGILPLEIIITKNDSVEIAMHDSLVMAHVQRFQDYVSEVFPYSNWVSLQKVLKQILYEISPQDQFPPDQETLDQLYLLTQGQTETLINFEENSLRISGMLPDLSSNKLDSIEASITKYVSENFPPWLSASITGTMPVALKTNNYLILDLFSGFGLAFIFISIVMGLMFFSVRIGLISMLPNLIPIIFAAGYLGFAGIPIRPPIAITFSICLGIAVDDSLHFLFRFWQERKITEDLNKAVANTIETTGLAMLTTTIVLVSGFLVITVSSFIPTAQFGIISAITLCVALITDITLLPVLLILFPVKFLHKKNDQSN